MCAVDACFLSPTGDTMSQGPMCWTEANCKWSGSVCTTDSCSSNVDENTCNAVADGKCLWANSQCSVACSAIVSDTECLANPVCKYDTSASTCGDNACLAHADGTACNAGDKCLWDNISCAHDVCTDHIESPCKTDSLCSWSSAESTCARDLCTLHDSSSCTADSTCMLDGENCYTKVDSTPVVDDNDSTDNTPDNTPVEGEEPWRTIDALHSWKVFENVAVPDTDCLVTTCSLKTQKSNCQEESTNLRVVGGEETSEFFVQFSPANGGFSEDICYICMTEAGDEIVAMIDGVS